MDVKVKITEVTKEDGYYNVVGDQDNGKDFKKRVYGSDDNGLLAVGNTVIFTIQKKDGDKYWNVTGFKAMSNEPQAKTSHKSSSTNESIEAQVAVKAGIELLVNKIITLDSELGKLTMAWCIKRLSDNVQSTEKPIKEEVSTTTQKIPDVDMDWLKKSLAMLKWNPVPWLNEHFNMEKETVTDCLLKMTKAQRVEFIQVVNDRLEKESPF